jgi:predicted metalloenzyme YecM
MDTSAFLNSFFEQINHIGLDISDLVLDHIAYQASSPEDYEKIKADFSLLGEKAGEREIGGRRVAVFRLKKPIVYKNYSIHALELIEPKEGQVCNSAFQHAEFVANQPFEAYIDQYPNIQWDISSMSRDEFAHLKLNFSNGLTLKFLKMPILDMLALESA